MRASLTRVSPVERRSAAADIAACRRLLRENSRTFFAASLLLPRSVREPASALYAFCRLADDAVDLEGGKLDAIVALRDRLDRAYRGCPLDVPADRAFAAVIERYALPRALPEALLEGFEWDAEDRRYEDIAALQAYGARVAGTVGAMMAVVMGVRAPDAVARACDLGVAMQLSNIARDVGEDARAGRLYLPLAWLREAGIDAPAWLAKPVFSPALGAVIRRLLSAADVLYERAAPGVPQLPLACQPGINAARLLYAGIGREVERAGFDSVSRRAVVPAAKKAQLLTRAVIMTGAAAAVARGEAILPLEQTRFLVDAVNCRVPPARLARIDQRSSGLAASTARAFQWWNLDDRAGWLLALFERLERDDEVRSQ